LLWIKSNPEPLHGGHGRVLLAEVHCWCWNGTITIGVGGSSSQRFKRDCIHSFPSGYLVPYSSQPWLPPPTQCLAIGIDLFARAAVTRAARSAVAGARRAAAVPLHGVDGAVARAVGAVARASGAAAVCLHGDGGLVCQGGLVFREKGGKRRIQERVAGRAVL